MRGKVVEDGHHRLALGTLVWSHLNCFIYSFFFPFFSYPDSLRVISFSLGRKAIDHFVPMLMRRTGKFPFLKRTVPFCSWYSDYLTKFVPECVVYFFFLLFGGSFLPPPILFMTSCSCSTCVWLYYLIICTARGGRRNFWHASRLSGWLGKGVKKKRQLGS